MGGSVSVDRDFARFGTKSYAINKINSVEVREQKPHGPFPFILSLVLALFFVLIALSSPSAATIIPALLMCGLVYWTIQRMKKTVYQLFLMTSSAEAQAIESENENEVLSLRDAIEKAMSGR